MKKGYKKLLVIILLLCVVILCSACTSTNETIHIDDTTESTRYFLYRTDDQMKYLRFLEDFDENKFEIVDISLSIGDYEAEAVYNVTYRYK